MQSFTISHMFRRVLIVRDNSSSVENTYPIDTNTLTLMSDRKSIEYNLLQLPILVELKEDEPTVQITDGASKFVGEFGHSNHQQGASQAIITQWGTPAPQDVPLESIETPIIGFDFVADPDNPVKQELGTHKVTRVGGQKASTNAVGKARGKKERGPLSTISEEDNAVKNRTLPKRLTHKLTKADKAFALKSLHDLMADEAAVYYIHKVDSEKLAKEAPEFAEYEKVVDGSMYLNLVHEKLNKDEYNSLKAITHDIEVMALKAQLWFNFRKSYTKKEWEGHIVQAGKYLVDAWNTQMKKATVYNLLNPFSDTTASNTVANKKAPGPKPSSRKVKVIPANANQA